MLTQSGQRLSGHRNRLYCHKESNLCATAMYIVVLLPMVSSRYGKYSCCKVRFIIIIGLFQWSLVDMKNTIVVRFGLFEIGAPKPDLISLAPFLILKIPPTPLGTSLLSAHA